ncbi:MAG: thioredoxin domain-containing protein [Candidatus Paceibacterota bacterium]
MDQHTQHDVMRAERSFEKVQNKNTLMVSASIILGAIIVGVCVLYAGSIIQPIVNTGGDANGAVAPAPTGGTASEAETQEILSIQSDDYVWGDPQAPVKLVLFTDLECPFCKKFDETLNTVMSTYGKDKKLAVVFRHFPLTNIHKKALPEAQALECAGKLGGNEAFWKFVNRVYTITTSNDGLDAKELPNIASFVGLNVKDFSACVAKNDFAQKIQKQQQDAVKIGVQGTPHSVVVAQNGKTFVINGAQDATGVSSVIDSALLEN